MLKRFILIFLSVFCLTSCVEEQVSYQPQPDVRPTPQYTPVEVEQPMGDNLILKISDARFDCDTDLMGRWYRECSLSFDIMVKDPEYRSDYVLKTFNVDCRLSVDYWTIRTYTKKPDPFSHTETENERIYLYGTNNSKSVKMTARFSGLLGDAYKAKLSDFRCSVY